MRRCPHVQGCLHGVDCARIRELSAAVPAHPLAAFDKPPAEGAAAGIKKFKQKIGYFHWHSARSLTLSALYLLERLELSII